MTARKKTRQDTSSSVTMPLKDITSYPTSSFPPTKTSFVLLMTYTLSTARSLKVNADKNIILADNTTTDCLTETRFC